MSQSSHARPLATARAALRAVRAQPALNAGVRSLLRQAVRFGGAFRKHVIGRWPVAGDVEVETHGVRFRLHGDCDDSIATFLYYGFPSEEGELSVWSLLADHARVLLDVGANTGVYSVVAAKRNPAVRVFAFEPHPTNYERLAHNLRINRLDGVTAVRAAVGDEDRQISFTVPADEAISLVSSAVKVFSEAYFNITYKQIDVTQVTLDSFLAREGIDAVDAIKIDVENYERAVLRGATQLLRKSAPVILLEVFNPDVLAANKPELAGRVDPSSALDVERFLFGLGYHAFAIGALGLLRVQDLRSIPDGGSNYLFSKVAPSWTYARYDDPARIAELFARRGA